MDLTHAKVAIVCDWLTNLGGAEKVIMSLHRLFPEAPLYTTLYDPQRAKGFEKATIYTSFLQRIPFAKKKHPLFLNAMPMAVESFDLSEYDLVISSSHSVAKGIITKPDTIHISYCHTPMRYAWEPWEMEMRLKNFPKLLHNSIKKRLHQLRLWDRLTADRVDHFIVNSRFVGERVKKYYRRDSTVIHPPVEGERFSPGSPKDYFLMVGRLIAYKKFDLVIETFNKLNKKLVIVGSGPEEKSLKKLAGSNIEFWGRVDDDRLNTAFQECQALLFPQLEDFGITPVECMAAGRPVIAYSSGGAQDTIIDGQTGVLFDQQNEESLSAALKRFESTSWDPQAIRQHALGFSEERFHTELTDLISSL